MKIQSLSIVVPNSSCINNCAFCISKMHCNDYKNQMDDNLPFFDLYLKDYMKRLEFARSNDCNTVMLTGTSEPQQNRRFLSYFGMFMQMMKNPFQWIEMQTTGVMLDRNYLRFLRNHVGVNLISLSVSSLDNDQNNKIIGSPDKHHIRLGQLCQDIKEYDFTLRMSLNLTSYFNIFAEIPAVLFDDLKDYGVDQVTLRILYSDGSGTDQDRWCEKNAASSSTIIALSRYIKDNGRVLSVLPYGAIKYSLNGMSVVIDDDCMAKEGNRRNQEENYKYLILRPDCKLYSQWDDPASIIF